MKKILLSLPLLVAAFLLSGCGSANNTEPVELKMNNATLIKSEDSGTTWSPKTRIDDKKTIAGINVLSLAINPNNPDIIYIGTESNGLFITKDGGETWTQVPFADKVYGLTFDAQNSNIIYGSGIFNGRAKIYKRFQEDQEWKEIYTEPSENTTISSLAVDKINSQIIYAGTSAGVIIKSADGGQTWANLTKADGPVINIVFDAANSAHMFFGIFQKGVLESKDGGVTIDDIASDVNEGGDISSLYTLVADPVLAGVIYIGTSEGIFYKVANEKWNSLDMIESSKNFPIRAIAINPHNPREIIYSSAKAIYKSTDGGTKWSTFQLDAAKDISILRYDPINPFKIYAGLRSF